MTVVLIVVVVILAIGVAVLAVPRVLQRTRRRPPPTARSSRRILFPFVAEDLSERALNAALRLAGAEGATLVPVFLARVSLDVPLDTPLPRQCSMGIPLLELDRAASHRGRRPRRLADRARPYSAPRAAPGDRRRSASTGS